MKHPVNIILIKWPVLYMYMYKPLVQSAALVLILQILDRAHFLPTMGIGEETRTQYQQLCQALDEYVRKTFQEWVQTIDRVCSLLLSKLIRSSL